jgi:DNA-binding NarL/FixJ family response regulator
MCFCAVPACDVRMGNVKPRAVIADDQAIVLAKVAEIVGFELDIVAYVGDGNAALEAAERLHPDLVILDISMPRLGGIEAARKFSVASDNPRVIFLTIYEDRDYLEAALAAGACGYVTKARMHSDLLVAVKEVLAGGIFVSPGIYGHCA